MMNDSFTFSDFNERAKAGYYADNPLGREIDREIANNPRLGNHDARNVCAARRDRGDLPIDAAAQLEKQETFERANEKEQRERQANIDRLKEQDRNLGRSRSDDFERGR